MNREIVGAGQQVWQLGIFPLLLDRSKRQLESKSYSIDFSSPLMKKFNGQNIDIFNISSAFEQLDNINSWLANKNQKLNS